MPKTQLKGAQVQDGSIQRADLDTTTAGQAVVRKIVQGTGVTISSDGADSGTGDVTINNNGEPALGNPTVDGYILSSTLAGIRSWIPPSGAAGRVFYYATSDASDIATYKTMLTSPSAGGETTVATPCTGTGDVLVAAFATDPGIPGAVDYPAGTADRTIFAKVSGGVARFHLQVFVRNAAGVETLARDEFSANFSDTVVTEQDWTVTSASTGTLLSTDRLVVKLYAQRVSGPTTVTVTTYFEGTSHTSQIQTTIETAVGSGTSLTLTGDVTGSGTGTIATQIAANAVGASEIVANSIGASEINNTQNLGLAAAQTVKVTDSATGATNVITISHNSSGTPGVNFGTSILFQAQSDTTVDRTQGQLTTAWSVAADGTRSAYLDLRTVLNGSLSTAMRLHASNGVSINNTTDPGAGFVNVPTAGGYKINNQLLSVDDIAATATNNTAPTGHVGQTIAASVISTSATSLTNNTSKNITSISLTAGDWDVRGMVCFNIGSLAAAAISIQSANIGTTSATIADDGEQGQSNFTNPGASAQNGTASIALPPRRISLASTTTIYLIGRATFASGTHTAFGFIEARRVR